MHPDVEGGLVVADELLGVLRRLLHRHGGAQGQQEAEQERCCRHGGGAFTGSVQHKMAFLPACSLIKSVTGARRPLIGCLSKQWSRDVEARAVRRPAACVNWLRFDLCTTGCT